MIRARFIKAVPLKDGTISYMLSGKRTKEALRLAVDLQDENCIIEIEKADAVSDSRLDYAIKAIYPILKEQLAGSFADGEMAREENMKEGGIPPDPLFEAK